MADESIILRCLNCGTKNRITRARMQDRPTCGRCRAPLDDMIIRCLSCGAKNRMPEERIHDRPRCGKCGQPLVAASGTDRPVEISDTSFADEVISSAEPVLVDCWAPWCGPCKAVAPILDELSSKYAGGAKITKINVDENPLIASQYGIRSIPTLLLFKNGKLVNRLVGALPKEEIERHLLAVMKMN